METYYFKEFFNNPSGAGATYLNINAIKRDFDTRYEVFKGKMKAESFLTNTGEIFIHVYFPSHSAEGIYYDVVFSFDSRKSSNPDNVNDAPMRIFSNSPSFIYTHAYSYMKHNLFILPLKKKYSPKVLENAAKAKNPRNTLSYDISVYCAMKFILETKLLLVKKIKEIQVGATVQSLLDRVQDADKIQKDRKEVVDAERVSRKLKAEEVAATEETTDNSKSSSNAATAKKVSSVKSVKTVKKI